MKEMKGQCRFPGAVGLDSRNAACFQGGVVLTTADCQKDKTSGVVIESQ